MQNFQVTFEARKRSFNSVFSICMAVPLNAQLVVGHLNNIPKVSCVNLRR